MHIFSEFLRFDMSLLLLTVTLRGYQISIAYCLFFSFEPRSEKNGIRGFRPGHIKPGCAVTEDG